MYNGADEDSFYPAVSTVLSMTPVVLFVGRLIPEKGVHVLLEAMRILAREGVRLQAKIIGSVNFGTDTLSPYAEALHRDCPHNTEFLPYMVGERLAEQFRNASIFCCPSTWEEPFGMVNVEAMASGLPVVASAVGGIPEIFTQGGGLLVPKNSAPELGCRAKVAGGKRVGESKAGRAGLRYFPAALSLERPLPGVSWPDAHATDRQFVPGLLLSRADYFSRRSLLIGTTWTVTSRTSERKRLMTDPA